MQRLTFLSRPLLDLSWINVICNTVIYVFGNWLLINDLLLLSMADICSLIDEV